MTRRPFLAVLSAFGLAPGLAAAQSRRAEDRAAGPHRREWKQRLAPAAYQVLRHEGTEYPGIEPAQRRAPQGPVRLRRLRPAAVHVGHQVRERHRLAELLRVDRRRGADQDRRQDDRSAHRVPLRALRRPPGPRLRRRPEADRQALLQQRRRAEVRRRPRRAVGAAGPARRLRGWPTATSATAPTRAAAAPSTPRSTRAIRSRARRRPSRA